MAEPRQPVDDAARPPLSSDLHDSDGLFVDTAAMSPHPGGMPTGSEGASANGDDNDPSGKTSHDDGADDQAIRSSSAANPAAPQPGGSAPANSELMRQVNDVLTSQVSFLCATPAGYENQLAGFLLLAWPPPLTRDAI